MQRAQAAEAEWERISRSLAPYLAKPWIIFVMRELRAETLARLGATHQLCIGPFELGLHKVTADVL